MTCTIENYQPNLAPCRQYTQEDVLFLEPTWLQTDIYEEFELHPEFASSTSAIPPNSLFTHQHHHRHSSARASSVAHEARAPAWWESELAASIHRTLKKKETSSGKIELKSPQLKFRTEIVDFLLAVCKHLGTSSGTRHTAVRLLDYFMDGHNVMYYRLKLVALTCLLIAAKFEERDDYIPTIDSLHYAARIVDSATSFTQKEIVALELYALKYFKWNISRPGIAHFIDYYQYVSLNNSCKEFSEWERRLLENQVQEFATGFMEAALREQKFVCEEPSKVAAAIVCVVRICSRMDTAWTPDLLEASTYSLEDLQSLASSLLRLHEDSLQE